MISRINLIEMSLSAHEKKIEDILVQLEPYNSKKHGIFFQNQIFDAYVFFSELIQQAKSSIILIDNYIDHSLLLQLAKRNEGVFFGDYEWRAAWFDKLTNQGVRGEG